MTELTAAGALQEMSRPSSLDGHDGSLDACVVECPPMELRQLETFRVVMATLSMTEAARRVYLSPAAVSLQMKRLSDELGADLFTRVGNKLVPTSAATRPQRWGSISTTATRSASGSLAYF